MSAPPPGSLLLVDDDPVFREVLAAALGRRGFDVREAGDVPAALAALEDLRPDYALVDLQMPGPPGLELLPALAALAPRPRIVVLTGYASIATAVEAIKLGATHYLTKPAGVDEILAAFQREAGEPRTPVAPVPVSVERLAWEHIQKVLAECGGNVSAAARTLGMHRRTLQRRLRKRPVRR